MKAVASTGGSALPWQPNDVKEQHRQGPQKRTTRSTPAWTKISGSGRKPRSRCSGGLRELGLHTCTILAAFCQLWAEAATTHCCRDMVGTHNPALVTNEYLPIRACWHQVFTTYMFCFLLQDC